MESRDGGGERGVESGEWGVRSRELRVGSVEWSVFVVCSANRVLNDAFNHQVFRVSGPWLMSDSNMLTIHMELSCVSSQLFATLIKGFSKIRGTILGSNARIGIVVFWGLYFPFEGTTICNCPPQGYVAVASHFPAPEGHPKPRHSNVDSGGPLEVPAASGKNVEHLQVVTWGWDCVKDVGRGFRTAVVNGVFY